MDLISMLPVLKGWRYSHMGIEHSFSISARRERVMTEAERSGWVISAMCTLNNPDAKFVVLTFDPYRGYAESTMGARDLYSAGLMVPNATGTWCSRYDDTAKVYVVVYTPATSLPFGVKYKLSIRAPPTEPVTVLGYFHVLIEIFDMDIFLRSLREALGAPITITLEAVREAIKIGSPISEVKRIPESV